MVSLNFNGEFVHHRVEVDLHARPLKSLVVHPRTVIKSYKNYYNIEKKQENYTLIEIQPST